MPSLNLRSVKAWANLLYTLQLDTAKPNSTHKLSIKHKVKASRTVTFLKTKFRNLFLYLYISVSIFSFRLSQHKSTTKYFSRYCQRLNINITQEIPGIIRNWCIDFRCCESHLLEVMFCNRKMTWSTGVTWRAAWKGREYGPAIFFIYKNSFFLGGGGYCVEDEQIWNCYESGGKRGVSILKTGSNHSSPSL